MPHQVVVSQEPPPAWWSKVEHFGTQVRLSMLFRQALSKKQQRRLVESRAMRLHGCSVSQLSKQTGQDEAYLVALLAQLQLPER